MTDSTSPFGQAKYQVRFDWGLAGADRILPGAHAVVVVDALSFTTSVVVAAEHGVAVAPWPAGTEARAGAEAFAAERGGLVAGRRGAPGPTLSPASWVGVAASPVVLPSPNGGALAHALGARDVVVIAAAMRNRSAVAERLLALQAERGERLMISIVAAGEREAAGADLRFGLEDLLVAGAVVDALVARGIDHTSPEAAVACAAFEGLSRATGHLVSASGSGVRLRELGYAGDARLAAERDVADVVPVLHDGVFIAE
ncbi:2-phosphosulfolactate phosphatase [Agromyces sp. H3Y2-19a]|uniref:2-phosphosulfolactate phosphatase n=1 Tax=Agromyces TaxID=33877 RepID=UPI0023B9E1DD|nr:2-phosphosulfolactate phosphatase [Agromyces chromiiresistens]MDF0512563.1 2-phosphosulfolactate phosphatase [Agromyces chromiiresistens]